VVGVTRRPVRGLAPIEPAPPPPRPPGPPTILGPDGRTWTRAAEGEWAGLYLDETGREVFSQAALRDLIERAQERLEREIRVGEFDPVLIAIAATQSPERLRKVYDAYRDRWTDVHTAAARGRRAVLALPPREDA
jgi:hypothetical protein